MRVGGRSEAADCVSGRSEAAGRAGRGRGWAEIGSPGTDYSQYRLTLPQRLEALAIGAGLAGAVAYACYRSWIIFFMLLIPAAAYMPFYMRKRWKEKRLRQLEIQFKEAIQIISTSLSAGLSVENAIASAGKEMELMYGPGSMMCVELSHMVQQMEMNRPVEELMNDFARRSGLEEIGNFARIFQIAKRSGGQLVPIISHTVQVMDDRFAVKEEIRTLTASKQFEQKVMNAMPFLMIVYIDSTSPGLFDMMYTTVSVRLIMTACLAVYLLACWMAKRILDISVM